MDLCWLDGMGMMNRNSQALFFGLENEISVEVGVVVDVVVAAQGDENVLT